MKKLIGLVLAVLALSAQAQAPAPKVAVVSLVGDTMNVVTYRERLNTNLMHNEVTPLAMPSPVFDHTLMKTVQDGVGRALPGASVALLRVPAAGSVSDPAKLLVDGQVAAGNALAEALKQQGYAWLVAATKLRERNRVALADITIGTGHLEGLGFYIDHTIRTQKVTSAETGEGILAPYVYVQLTLIDLANMKVRSQQAVMASAVVSSNENKVGMGAWGAMTPQQKVDAIDRLIQRHVGAAVPKLFTDTP